MSAIFVPRVSRVVVYFSRVFTERMEPPVRRGCARPGVRVEDRRTVPSRGSSAAAAAGSGVRRTTPGWWIRPWSSDDLAFASRGRLARRSTPPRQSQMRRGPHGRRAPNSFPVGDHRRSPCRRRVRDGSRPWAGTGASRSPPTADATTRRTMADPRTRDVPPTRSRLPPSAAPAANARGHAPE